MTIQKDAGEILAFLYKKYLSGSRLDYKELAKETRWDKLRLKRAIDYLLEIEAIKGIKMLDETYIIRGILPVGIDMIKNKEKFK